MNIKRQKIETPVPVSQQSYTEKQEQQMQLEESVLTNKSMRIDFSSGVSMAKINVEITNRFGLKWHFENTKSLTEFLESVQTFLGDKKLDQSDILKLTNEYKKHK